MTSAYDAVIIGGGFYGSAIAVYLAKTRGFSNVLLVEREKALLQRASYNNQARIHNGYHYPRSFTTAYRSRINLPRFVRDWPDAVQMDFMKIYAIARKNSKVTGRQFERFCESVGARLEPVDAGVRQLFDSRLIESLYLVQEYAFNTVKLAEWAAAEMAECGVKVKLDTTLAHINRTSGTHLDAVLIDNADGATTEVPARYVFNCTYSGLNHIAGDFPGVQAEIRHEMTEMALIKPPPELEKLGVTVMDGPFFSMMPFPAKGLHTLSHVRYTPHLGWADSPDINPYRKLEEYPRETRVEHMLRDVARYIPAVARAEYRESLYEVKTILKANDSDDGRPIFFEQHLGLPGCYSILGGKIDNIYDVIEKLDEVVAA